MKKYNVIGFIALVPLLFSCTDKSVTTSKFSSFYEVSKQEMANFAYQCFCAPVSYELEIEVRTDPQFEGINVIFFSESCPLGYDGISEFATSKDYSYLSTDEKRILNTFPDGKHFETYGQKSLSNWVCWATYASDSSKTGERYVVLRADVIKYSYSSSENGEEEFSIYTTTSVSVVDLVDMPSE